MSEKYFGESAFYDINDEIDVREAKEYLILWKKFLLRRLKRDLYDVEILHEQWGERPPDTMLFQMATMYLKLHIKANWHYELGK